MLKPGFLVAVFLFDPIGLSEQFRRKEKKKKKTFFHLLPELNAARVFS